MDKKKKVSEEIDFDHVVDLPIKKKYKKRVKLVNKGKLFPSNLMEKVYAFEYNPMFEESGPITVSLHQTKKGAEIAMEFHKEEVRKEWEEDDKRRKEEYGDEYEMMFKHSKFGQWEHWCVTEMEILH